MNMMKQLKRNTKTNYLMIGASAIVLTMFMPSASNASDGLTLVRDAVMNGWEDREKLVPHDYSGTWRQEDPMSCVFQETRTIGSCSNRQRQRRTWTATAPGQTPSWGSWETVSTYNDCPPPPSSGGGSNGGGGSGMSHDTNGDGDTDTSGRGDCCNESGSPEDPSGTDPSRCFIAGTKVLMGDGTLKDIDKIEVGEFTATGRVIQTRGINIGKVGNFTKFTQQELETIYLYAGIKVTGEHAVYEDGEWPMVQHAKYAVPHMAEGHTVVYNMLVENALIPIVNDHKQLYYFADSRNNDFGESELGFAKLNIDGYQGFKIKVA
jgi:hypothetical protein